MFKRMFFRSLLMQAGWNYERFQNLGFAYCLQPALEKFYPDPEKRKAALLRHLAIVNTQPYMASFVVGNVAAMEERAAAAPDQEAALKSMPGVKQALATSFASIGDRIFWGRLKPMTVQLCVLLWAAGGFFGWLFTGLDAPVPAALLFAGPLAGVVIYSAVALYWRWRGLKVGYSCGGASSCGLDCADWPALIRRLSAAGFAMSLAIAALAFWLLWSANRGAGPGALALKFAAPLAAMGLHRVCRAYGRSVFFAAGILLAVSLLLFSTLNFRPFTLYL